MILSQNRKTITLKALIDTSAQGSIFISKQAAHKVCDYLEIEPVQLLRPRLVRGYNSTTPDQIKKAIYPTISLLNHI